MPYGFSELQKIRQDYLQLIESIPYVEEDLNYTLLDRHIPWLQKMDQMNRSAISVFDMYKKTHVYMSPSYKNRLGLPQEVTEAADGFDQFMTPDDLVMLMKAGYHFLKLMLSRENKNYHQFMLVNDYCIHPPDGKTVRLTEQHSILETDLHDNIWLGLSIITLSADQNVHEPVRSRLVDQEEDMVTEFPESNGFANLTVREKEILSLISEGLASKQIADRLHVSIHTVNTHRQNIIKKMNVANSAEAIRMATLLGIIKV